MKHTQSRVAEVARRLRANIETMEKDIMSELSDELDAIGVKMTALGDGHAAELAAAKAEAEAATAKAAELQAEIDAATAKAKAILNPPVKPAADASQVHV